MEAIHLSQGSELAGGRYVLERRLGVGGMATVWMARDTSLARSVAIKLPSRELTADSTFGQRFEREAQTAAALSHPNLVPVFDYGSEAGRPYLVSEFIDGSNLAHLRDDGEQPPTEEIARALLDALAHIHEAGIVHRDIKPGNVLVDGNGRILLTDFGIAQSTEASRLTATGMVIGTISYIAPEVRQGGRATPASDLYACGTLLGGQLNASDPDRVGRLVDALTREDPADRPAGAGEALELLERKSVEVTTDTSEMTAERPVSPRPPEAVLAPRPPQAVLPPRRPEPLRSREFPNSPGTGDPPPRRSRAFPFGIAAGLALVMAVVAFALISGGDDEPPGGDGNANAGKQNETPQAVTTTETTTAAAPEEPADVGVEPVSAGDDPAAGAELNQEGYDLLQSGDVGGALPKLQAAVAAFPDDSTDINYAYALFNYAQALRLSGDPASAIPLLQKRLAISDFRVADVQAELATAEEAAGGKSPKPPKEPKPPKP